MQSLGLLFVFLVGGYVFKKLPQGRDRAPHFSRRLNQWVIRAALPALVFVKIHELPEFSLTKPEVYLPVSQPWMQFAFAFLVVTVLARALGWSRGVWGALVMTVGLGNTSFVGFPLLRALLGPEALSTGVIQDQLGSFLILSAVGIPFAQMASPSQNGPRQSVWTMLLRPLKFPAFVSLIFALLLARWQLPQWLQAALSLLASSLAPAALISVGMSLSFSALKRPEIRNPLALGVMLKLLVFPALYFWIYPAWAAAVGGVTPLVLQAVLLESAMASQIVAGVVASEQGLEPALARLMVGVSIPLSLLTVPIWAQLARLLANP